MGLAERIKLELLMRIVSGTSENANVLDIWKK